MIEFPTLDYFFGVYLHEDWPDDYGNEWAALDAFMAEGPPEDLQLFRDEIAQLLGKYSAEEDLRKIILEDLGSYLDPTPDGWNYRDWCLALSNYIGKATGHPRAS